MDFKTIVVATDFSEASLRAAETAFSLAMENNARLYLVHVIEAPIPYTGPYTGLIETPYKALYESASEQMERIIPENVKKGLAVLEKVVMGGAAARAIADLATEKEADLIVVGTHGRSGLSKMFLGSTAEKLLRQAPCQVLVVKPKAPSESTDTQAPVASSPSD